MTQAFQLAPGKIFRAEKPIRNPRYLRFVRRFACAACRSTRDVVAAHTGGHGLGSKASDMQAVPLCRECHAAYDANPRGFAKGSRLNIKKLIVRLNSQFQGRL